MKHISDLWDCIQSLTTNNYSEKISKIIKHNVKDLSKINDTAAIQLANQCKQLLNNPAFNKLYPTLSEKLLFSLIQELEKTNSYWTNLVNHIQVKEKTHCHTHPIIIIIITTCKNTKHTKTYTQQHLFTSANKLTNIWKTKHLLHRNIDIRLYLF